MNWELEISQDFIVSKVILEEKPIYLSSGKKSKRTKIPFMDVWKKYKDGLKQVGFGIYKSSCEKEDWILFFKTKNRLGDENSEKNHIEIRNKYFKFFANTTCEISHHN